MVDLWCSLRCQHVYTHELRIHSTLELTPDNRLANFINSNVVCYTLTHYTYTQTTFIHSILFCCVLFDSFVGAIINTFTHLRFAIVCTQASPMFVYKSNSSTFFLSSIYFGYIIIGMRRLIYAFHTNTNNRNRTHTIRLFRLDYSFRFTHSARNINKWFFDSERANNNSWDYWAMPREWVSECEGIWIDVSKWLW